MPDISDVIRTRPVPTENRSANERRAREHFERADTRLSSIPLHVHIETTTRCNAACITCTRGHLVPHPRDLDVRVFDMIARDLLPTAISVNLAGVGEPMLARHFDRFLDEVARAGTRLHLVTNGSALSMRRMERLARLGANLAISVDGATRETFESIRRKLSFDRVIESLRAYKKMCDLYPEAGPTLWINFVALRGNIEELPAMVDLAADVGAQSVYVLDMGIGAIPAEVAAQHLSRCPELANRMFREAAERAEARAILLQCPPQYATRTTAADASPVERPRRGARLFSGRSRFPRRCADPWVNTYISAEGHVRPCCGFGRAMGDLNRHSFARIWNGMRYRWLRRRLGSFMPPLECRNCNLHLGINAGNNSAVRANEGLIIKVLYRFEIYARRLWDRLK